MEIDQNPKKLAKKLWKMVRIVLYMVKKGLAKSNLLVDLHMLLKKGKVGSKFILGNITMHGYYSTLTCRSHDITTSSFFTPQRYESNCGYSTLTCRPNDITASFISPREYEFSCSNTPVCSSRRTNAYRKEEELNLVNKVLNMLNHFDDVVEESPPSRFGRSSMENARGAKERHQVDNDAEEFINKFYKDLQNQRRIAAMESPSPYHL